MVESHMVTDLRSQDDRAFRCSVLIVDDDAMTRLLCSRCLENAGFEVVCVSSGSAALAALSVQAFDIMLLDNIMPELTGVELLEMLPSHPLAARPRIFMLSATQSESMVDRCKALGAEDVLSKPILPAALRDLALRTVER
jgi:CheY-like chemotaxis protein